MTKRHDLQRYLSASAGEPESVRSRTVRGLTPTGSPGALRLRRCQSAEQAESPAHSAKPFSSSTDFACLTACRAAESWSICLSNYCGTNSFRLSLRRIQRRFDAIVRHVHYALCSQYRFRRGESFAPRTHQRDSRPRGDRARDVSRSTVKQLHRALGPIHRQRRKFCHFALSRSLVRDGGIRSLLTRVDGPCVCDGAAGIVHCVAVRRLCSSDAARGA
jgi:hypothetical protein